MLRWKSHHDNIGDARLDFFCDIFLDEKFDGSPIVVDEYRLLGRSGERMRVAKVRDANHDLCLTDVVERLGLLRQLPKPIGRPRGGFVRVCEDSKVPEFLIRLKFACRIPSRSTEFLS